jgi:hypothetical protein
MTHRFPLERPCGSLRDGARDERARERRGEGTRGSIAINEKSYPLLGFSTYASFSKRTCKRVATAQP